jgi:hypothetical protein
MDYTALYRNTLENLGFDVVLVPNAFDVPYNPESGWPVKLPRVEFKSNTLLVMHFQDFVTVQNNQVLELEILEQHYGSYSNQILVTHWNRDLKSVYSGPINLIEFCNHNYALINRLNQRKSEWVNVIDNIARLGWQCLNGRMCYHRRRVVDVVQSWPNGSLSYGNEIPLLKWNYATYRGTDNDENFIRLAPLYAQHAVNIVTETEYDTYPGIITEKTVLAMLACQIPIVIGYPGIVSHIRDMGLDTFDDVVDTSYDFLSNDTRLEQALLRNKKLITGKIDVSVYWSRLKSQQNYVLRQLPIWYENNFSSQAQRLAQRLLS